MDLYHVLNRGVDKRVIFNDNQDRARFVHDMFEFNNADSAHPLKHGRLDFVSPTFSRKVGLGDDRKMIVDIHGWVLMGNHYHLLLSERIDGGLTKFIRKLNIGYAKYYNERHHRSGTLFQGRTKKVLINSNAQCLHILNYLHFNPLDMLEGAKSWRQRQIKDEAVALEHLRNYRWSSYQDYSGIRNFPSILSKEFFQGVFPNYEKQVSEYMQDICKQDLRGLSLE